jgi:uncharacterized protein DUF1592/uncharacterized protein DUF1588/uncharacterized protein DUF1587/uncharacterized protein DUF1585/uncharacterized protein DUF1595
VAHRLHFARRAWLALRAGLLFLAVCCPGVAADSQPPLPPSASALLKRYCFDCHAAGTVEGQVNIEQMVARPDLNAAFKKWTKVAAMLQSRQMPPKDATQPTDDERQQLADLIRSAVTSVAEENAGDPGPVALRRLTSAEYAYAIQDLTGLDLDLEREFVSDAAGGEGFTNVGSVQFLDDAGLERYLDAAKRVASHATIGSGPLQFFNDPGKTGLELSAINRIRQIYREHGFRTAAGEGAVPFGLDRYPRAFFVAWQYQHRDALDKANASLASLATDEGLPPRFVEHVWSVLNQKAASFPTSDIVSRWRKLPAPQIADGTLGEARKACGDLYRYMSDMQVRLAKAVGDDEEAPILSENTIQVEQRHTFVARFAWMEPPANTRVQFAVLSGNPTRKADAVVVWRNPRLRFRRLTRRRDEPQPLTELLSADEAKTFAFGVHPRGGEVGPRDFVTIGEESRGFDLVVPEGARGLEVSVDVDLDLKHGEDCVVRCSIVEGADSEKLKTNSALLADPQGEPFRTWKAGVAEFARLLPQISHREAAPSDRDPIPFPFNNAYNMPERNFFHTGVKYHRDDRFLTEYLLDEPARERLEQAWTDLLSSFEYHDLLLRFAAGKFKLDLGGRTVATLDEAWIDSLPVEVRTYVRDLRTSYVAIQARLKSVESHHVDDVFDFASRAWRRPLTSDEKTQLQAFYATLRSSGKLDHSQAARALLTRILVAPDFLYRTERHTQTDITPLNDWELASRLSFLLWSSLPDAELRRAAASGKLQGAESLALQVRRMLHDPKARRFATEFFGQWLGFYQFDRYRGVDPERFPEFTDRLRTALYDEAVSFFEHMVRDDRPVSEILFADYALLNADVAKHYGIDAAGLSESFTRADNVVAAHRGGLMGLAAVLTVTSAPLRTSPVKRGDWILRRVLDTPVPPPPANAGSIAADDAPADGKTVRQRLEAHRREASCVNCHTRIDPLGFALEHYDSLGRWRATYRSDEPIDDAITFGEGPPISGPEGLRQYLHEHQDQFYRTLVAKLLAYSLGRGELASDRPVVQNMLSDVRSGDGTIADLLVDIALSKQFRHRRGIEVDRAQAAGGLAPEGASDANR